VAAALKAASPTSRSMCSTAGRRRRHAARSPGDSRIPTAIPGCWHRRSHAEDYAKLAFRAAGVPVAEHIVASRLERKGISWAAYVIKPVAEGSSVGSSSSRRTIRIRRRSFIATIGRSATRWMIERYIPARS